MAAGALSGLQNRSAIRRWCGLFAGWRLTPYPAYETAAPSGVGAAICRMAAGALSGLQNPGLHKSLNP